MKTTKTMTGALAAELRDVKPALHNAFVAAAQTEPGTLTFTAAPYPAVAGRFLLSETYADKRAWESHRNGKCCADFCTAVNGHVTGPNLVVEGVSIPVSIRLT
ncbi:putative quinol monooxygenase [Allokutzneria sp. NRRL B-24872]|uniref:putative quinol monooxygenase n=1 Tax=Allokutzneria sp. NRRL B-24872 TaxID=1137961 RepID=UPI000A36052E|nr:hypothetical protein [Allokutzneria sp. NRRL B-24872]